MREITGRGILKSNWDLEIESDQSRGLEMPPQSKAAEKGSTVVELPAPEFKGLSDVNVVDALLSRRSRRKFTSESILLQELSFLLFATMGVQKELRRASLRPYPSAGARHPFELYVAAFRVEGLEPGIYRYLAFEHALCLVDDRPDAQEACDAALLGQGWNSAGTLLWTALPYRTEWRYSVKSPKLIALDAGHSCENLYLACEAIGCGTCAVGAYDQESCDALLGVDGENEFTVYAAPVGKVAESTRAQ